MASACGGGVRRAAGCGAAVAATIWFATRPAAPQVSRTTLAATGTTGLTIGGADRDLAADGTRLGRMKSSAPSQLTTAPTRFS